MAPTYTKCPHGVSTVFRLGPDPVLRLFLTTPEAENIPKQRSSPSTEHIFYFYSFSGDGQHWKLKTCHNRPSSPSPGDIPLFLSFPRVVHISTRAPTAQRARAKECYVQTARLTSYRVRMFASPRCRSGMLCTPPEPTFALAQRARARECYAQTARLTSYRVRMLAPPRCRYGMLCTSPQPTFALYAS